MARNCGECLMNDVEVVELAPDGKCPRCGVDYGKPAPDPNLAECGACGRNKPVCCDSGYSEDPETGKLTHVGAVCVDCCRPHHKGGAIWHGKSVAGGTYERCE